MNDWGMGGLAQLLTSVCMHLQPTHAVSELVEFSVPPRNMHLKDDGWGWAQTACLARLWLN